VLAGSEGRATARLMCSHLLLSLCWMSVSTALAGRQRISFDFGWRHRPGLHEGLVPRRPPLHPEPTTSPDEAAVDYDDSAWQRVQLPHDGLIDGAVPSREACPSGCSGRSFIARKVLWYRKRFRLPEAWRGSAVWLDFEGAFRDTRVYFNGEVVAHHDCGYTPFRVRLDNTSSIAYGDDTTNVLAVFIDPDNGDEGGRDHGSGWWYEGGGLYRHVWLTCAHHLHVEQDGLFAHSDVRPRGRQGLRAAAQYRSIGRAVEQVAKGSQSLLAEATLHASATITGSGEAMGACYSFELSTAAGEHVARTAVTLLSIPVTGVATARGTMSNLTVLAWSAQTPVLYTLRINVWASQLQDGVCADASKQNATDSVSVVHGFRKLRFDANDGFFLNDEPFKIRGFCDHNDFAVVGMAVPERVSLFRAQALRAVGGNGRRMSHNPPDVSELSIYDRLGIVVMDENRLFANSTKYVHNMGVLVRRDRNAPSVVVWSFCNEAGCEGWREAGGPPFYEVTRRYDGSRPTLGNMFTFGDLLSNTIDVQGFSHTERSQLDKCHAALPKKPIFMSECCSCNTERDEDEGCETLHDNPPSIGCRQKAFNGRCAQHYTNASDGISYAAGTMVWTLFDYYGEPSGGWPRVSSSYGQYDLAGFAKASAFWYRTQWLLRQPDTSTDKPFATHGMHEVHIVESWESPAAVRAPRAIRDVGATGEALGNAEGLRDITEPAGPQGDSMARETRSITAYTSAASAELFVNDVSIGVRSASSLAAGGPTWVEWKDVPWSNGTLRAVGRNAHGATVASDERVTGGRALALRLSLDAPSERTLTGKALLLDGHDAALVRVEVVDGAGNVLWGASPNITFEVVSGPGVLLGAHNGDTQSHEPNSVAWRSAYHGKARAVVRVSSTAGRDAIERKLMQYVDIEVAPNLAAPPHPIVIRASTPGLLPTTVSIPTSIDPTDGVLSVAAQGAGRPVPLYR